MKKNKGFTLIELIATIVILGLVATIGSYAISTTIKNSKEKNYELLIANIESAAEMYYQDCKYVSMCTFQNPGSSEYLQVSLNTLLANGFLTSNKTKSQSGKLYNPKTDDEISECTIIIQKTTNNNGLTTIKVTRVSETARDEYQNKNVECPNYTN